MVVPGDVVTDGDAKIFTAVNNFDCVTMEPVFSISFIVFISNDADDLAFLRVELHLPCSLPFLQGLQILVD